MKRMAFVRILSGLFAPLAILFTFSVQAANGLTVLHTFDHSLTGDQPRAGLVQGNDGAFYGTTYVGGAHDYGEVYKVDTGGNFSILHSFEGPEGAQPNSALVPMDDGNFYGTTTATWHCNGGVCSSSGGSVFRMSPDGTLTVLHTFETESPGALTASRDGLLYGVTVNGGSTGAGTAYAIATDGTYVHLADFNGANGNGPYGPLTEGADGNFYGTTMYGGAYNKGIVFRMTPDGTITTLHDFSGGNDGSGPSGSLLQGDDGRFYGGAGGGSGGRGTVFAITTHGELTTLHTFNGDDGAGSGALAQGSDGYIYGVSGSGYRLKNGTLFRLSTSGLLTTLHLFAQKDGTGPASVPIFGSDGRLYGTTVHDDVPRGSPGRSGTVYAFDLAAPRTPELHLCQYDSHSRCHRSVKARVGATFALHWTSANVVSCRASGAWNGMRPTAGVLTIRATQPGKFLYRLDCAGPNGPASAQVVVTVKPR